MLRETFKEAVIPDDFDGQPISDLNFSLRETADVEVIFRDITEKLCEQIDQAECVFGCVAWLTSEPILKALAKKSEVGIIVQKEDFLRPDSGKWAMQKQRDLYQLIPGFHRMSVRYLTSYCCADGNPDAAIRCVGFHNSKGSSAFPRMHNKFLVFCKRHYFRWDKDYKSKVECEPVHEYDDYVDSHVVPYSAWTGSFNPTYNASNSLENAILIRDAKIADAYMREFGAIFGLSEKLNWTKDWVSPQYRIGT